jgi:hypothetical protein
MAAAAQRLRQLIVKLAVSTVVRETHRGESHGGVFLLDLQQRSAQQLIDWAKPDIDWLGSGGDRGLRGIAFDKDRVYVAASNQLLAFSPDFRLLDSWNNPYLKYAHGIFVWQRMLYISSAGYDSILGFDLDQQQFTWAMHVNSQRARFKPSGFDPQSDNGPLMLNKLHLNNVYCNADGMYIVGLRSNGMLHFNGEAVNMAVQLPAGSRDARPFRDGVIFNDSDSAVLRYTGRGEGAEDRAMALPDDVPTRFARGLCVLSDTLVAGGSAPSTLAVYDLANKEMLGSVHISSDKRNAIHSIAQWPFD